MVARFVRDERVHVLAWVARRREQDAQLIHTQGLALLKLDGNLLTIKCFLVSHHLKHKSRRLGRLCLRLWVRPRRQHHQMTGQVDRQRVAALRALNIRYLK